MPQGDLPFPPTSDRASFKLATVYAVDGKDDWIYFGQVSAGKKFAFFRFRATTVSAAADALASPVMSRLGVWLATVGTALRAGAWRKLAVMPLVPGLDVPRPFVQWPHFTSTATVWLNQDARGGPTYDTQIDDPAIQEMEIAAAWDASAHVPKRLRLDYGDVVPDSWYVGGPVWRQRRAALAMARRSPDNKWLQQRAAEALLPPEH